MKKEVKYRDEMCSMIKQIPNHPDYSITEKGEVFSIKSGKLKKMTGTVNSSGYKVVTLYTSGKNKQMYVHTLILMAFDRLPKKGEECRHLDGIRVNSYLSNLKWGTRQENSDDKYAIHKSANTPKNEEHWKCKISNDLVKLLRKMHDTGRYKQIDLCKLYSISPPQMSIIINNKARIL